MNPLLFDSVIGSLKRAPLLAALVIFLIALGIGVSVPMMTVHHHLNADPIPGKSRQLFIVQLDNWRKEEPFRQPNEAPNAVTYQDATNLQKSTIPVMQAPMYLGTTTITFETKGLRPIKLDTRMTGRDFFAMFETPFLHGNVWTEDAERNRQQVAVISKTLSSRLFGEENSVGQRFLVNNRYFNVVGVIDDWQLMPRFYDMNNPFASVEHLYLPYSLIFSEGIQPNYWRTPYPLEQTLSETSFESLFSSSEIIFAQYWVQLDHSAQIDQYQAFLNQYVTEQKSFGRFPRELNNRLPDSIQWIEKGTEDSRDAGGVIALLVVMLLFFAVCLINSISILLTKFLRYKNRVGILRALGASRQFIFAQHLLEVTTLAVLGGGLGIIFASFGLDAAKSLYERDAAQGVNGMLAYQSFDAFWTLDITMIIMCFVMALIGGWAAGLYPAWKICKLPPSTELKSL